MGPMSVRYEGEETLAELSSLVYGIKVTLKEPRFWLTPSRQ